MVLDFIKGDKIYFKMDIDNFSVIQENIKGNAIAIRQHKGYFEYLFIDLKNKKFAHFKSKKRVEEKDKWSKIIDCYYDGISGLCKLKKKRFQKHIDVYYTHGKRVQNG